MRIYISGKVTGLDFWNYMTHFNRAENKLMAQGYSVVNPAVANSTLPRDLSHDDYMVVSMAMLSICDTIYMLDNWKSSEGAKREYEYAVKHGYKVMYEEDKNAT